MQEYTFSGLQKEIYLTLLQEEMKAKYNKLEFLNMCFPGAIEGNIENIQIDLQGNVIIIDQRKI